MRISRSSTRVSTISSPSTTDIPTALPLKGILLSAIKGITPVLNVSSVPQSIEWFEQFGWVRGFTWNEGGEIADKALRNEQGEAEFGSVCADNATIFLCNDCQGQRANDCSGEGMWMAWWIESKSSLDALHARAVDLGCEITHPPTDEPWGVREFHLKHPDGHIFRCSCGID